MLEKYEWLRVKIRKEIDDNHNYEKAISLCDSYISRLKNEEHQEDCNDDYWASHYNKALSYKKNNKCDKAIYWAMLAKKFTYEDKYDNRYIYGQWLIAVCNGELNLKDEALKIYTECYIMFKGLEQFGELQTESKFSIIFNKVKLLKKDNKMITLIHMYENYINHDLKTLVEMYMDIINLYKETKQIGKIFLIVSKIKNKELRLKLSTNLIA